MHRAALRRRRGRCRGAWLCPGPSAGRGLASRGPRPAAVVRDCFFEGMLLALARRGLMRFPPPPPPSRTNWTRLVPPSVLTGHVQGADALLKEGADPNAEDAHLATPLHCAAGAGDGVIAILLDNKAPPAPRTPPCPRASGGCLKGDHTVLSCYVSPGTPEKLTLVDLSLTEIEGERARQNHPDSPALPHRRGSTRATQQVGRRCTARRPSTPRRPRDSSSTTARTWTPFPPRAARRSTSRPCTAPQASPRYALRRAPVPQDACAQRGSRDRALSGITVVLPRPEGRGVSG